MQQQLDTLNLKQDIYKAFIDLKSALQAYNAATRSAEAAEKALDAASKRYNIGMLNTTDLIAIQSKLYTARLQKTVALYDYIFKLQIIRFYSGDQISL